MIVLKNLSSSFESRRARPEPNDLTNGGAVEIVGDFPFMLSLACPELSRRVEAFIESFNRIEIHQC
jgi:hypothetical protein